MPEARIANSYTFQVEGAEISLMPGLTGEPIATLRIDGREASGVEVAEHSSHWMVTGETEVIPDERSSVAHVRIPVVHLTSSEPQAVTALLTVVTSHTNIQGAAGVTGPLETYQTRLVEGEASEVHTLGSDGAGRSLGVHGYETITVVCNHELGGDTEFHPLYATGAVIFRTTGWKMEARRAGGDTADPAPNNVAFELVLSHSGGVSSDVLTRVEFRYDGSTEGVEYDTASFAVIGTDDAPPDPVRVLHPQ